MNRSKRESGDHKSYLYQKQGPSNTRKLGNILNRPQKLSRSPIVKLQYRQQPSGIQNNSRQYSNISNKKPSVYNEEIQDSVDNFEDNLNTKINVNINQNHKKESDKRNRQFVTKVEHINKMHEQISCLLQYVKNGESKSVCKQKQNMDKSVTTKSIEGIIKQRMNTSIINDKHKISYNLNEDSSIVPITQKQGEIVKKMPTNQAQYDHVQRQPYIYFKATPKKQSNIVPSKSGTNISAGKLNYRINHQNDFNHDIKSKKKYNQRKQFQFSNADNSVRPEINTAQKQQMENTNKKNKFVYNFDSKQSQIKQFVNKSQLKRKEGKYEKNAIDYDYQIQKVRQRIQDSEQMTKKMQQKYLQTHHSKISNTFSQYQDYMKSFDEKKTISKHNKSIDNLKNRSQKKRYLNLQETDTKTERVHNFELKVHPCKSRIQIQRSQQGKDQINRIIASRLSDQVKLDQKLRDARQIFNNCKANDKWKFLQYKLQDLGYSYTQQQLQKQLVISPNQSNPFQNQSYNSDDSINILAQAFVNAQQFWQSKLSKFIMRSRLQSCGYLVKQMDLDQRGYLTVQDLVCFINLYSSNFFRNRDLICLFRRMMALGKNLNGIQYQCFLNIISSQ